MHLTSIWSQKTFSKRSLPATDFNSLVVEKACYHNLNVRGIWLYHATQPTEQPFFCDRIQKLSFVITNRWEINIKSVNSLTQSWGWDWETIHFSLMNKTEWKSLKMEQLRSSFHVFADFLIIILYPGFPGQIMFRI